MLTFYSPSYDMKLWSEDGRMKNLGGKHSSKHVYGMVRSPVLTATR